MDEQSANRPESFRASSRIALLNLISRVLGFAGDTVKSHYFGAGGRVDAFNIAASVPTLLNDLLIKSLIDSAAIPVLHAYSEQERRTLATALLNLTTLAVALFVFILEVGAPGLVRMISGAAPADVQVLTVDLLHITLPALLLFNLSGVLSALLYTKNRLVLPAAAGAALNGAILIAALALQSHLGIFALAFGLLIGALVQAKIQLIGLIRLKVTVWRLRLWHPGLRQIAGRFLPILGGLLVEVLISRPATFALAAQTGEGSISWLSYALTLRQMPEALIAASLSVTILVRLSAETDLTAFRSTLVRGLRLALLLIVPASFGLFTLAQPVVALLFEHGQFSALDTQITAQALRWYLLGLPFATLDLLLVVAFYARHDTRTPALIGVFSTALYLVAARLLIVPFGLNGLILADSLKYAVHACLSGWLLFRAIGGLAGLDLARTLVVALFASLWMGVAAALLSGLFSGETLVIKFIRVLLPTLSGFAIYLITLTRLRPDDLRLLLSALPFGHSENRQT